MKKTTYVNKGIVFLLFITLFCSNYVFAQLPVPFSPRLPGGSIEVKGDIVLIGNGIVTAKDLPLPYNGTGINNNNEGVYINVASGGDPSIFSSSSADLLIDNDCKRILYAGLYWASVYPLEVATNRSVQFEGTPRIEDWNQIKFKLPTGGFIDLVADNDSDPVGEEDDIIFDGYEYYGAGVTNSFKDSPIICYKNVTNLLQGLTEADGEYTVANLRATRGVRRGGCSAGWTLVVIYENPLLPSKFISTFDGYAGVQGGAELDIPVSGFQTLPAPLPVNSNIGVAALEGDIGISGDSFQFKASTSGTYTVLSDAINQANNFFNSSITRNGVHAINRNPASLNTLGLDINNFNLPNPLNSVLPNNATAGDLKLTTSGDGYGVFLTSFAVEIIEPKITLTKVVEDPAGNDIGNQLVDLGDELNYVIGFQNTGNDDATNLTIRDILPVNVVFNYPADMDLLPPGVSVQSYNPVTREIIFSVDDSVVEENDPVQEIRFKVTVVSSCSLLNDACSNIISNQAYVTYNGTINSTFAISDDPSFSKNTGCLITPAATNFLADLNCTFEEEVVLCGASTVLTSGDGYDEYSWSTSPSGTPVIGTTQSITVTSTGTYYVSNTAIAPCQSTSQRFDVITFGAGVTNPVIPFADEVVICPNDGKELPNIFLCGANGSRFIQTGITDTTSMIWEKLDESSCTAVTNQDCANEDDTCSWSEVAIGPDFMVDTAGQYRLTLNYTGGCFNRFYFNVYTNLLVPTVNSRDIYCTTPGEIVVGGVPNGYEYSLDGINYHPNNTFSINTGGVYSVYIKQIGVTPNPCVFTVPDVQIRERDFTVSTIITQPYCNGELGSVVLSANDVRPQYFFSIYDGATLVNSVGPINDNNYTFSNLNPGIYTVNILTEDGCTHTEDVEIINPPLLEATVALTQPLTCTDGEITVYPMGGTPPYFYFVNSTTVFQTTPIIPVTSAGVYNITVVDSNNCSADASISVEATPAPDFSVTKTDILCFDNVNSGSININVTNPNGNSLRYSIDNGVTFTNSPVFIGLTAGDYDVVVEYTFGTDVCLSTPQLVTIIASTAISGTATLTTPYTCTTNGVITVSGVSGGNPPYMYSLDGFTFQSGTTFSGLTDGTYTVTIQDANNCTFVTAPITIDPLNPPTDLTFSNTPLSCPAVTTDVTISSTGGTLPLEYQIIAPAASATAYQSSNVFMGLTPDTYTFQVRDANECIYSESYTIDALPALTIVGQVLNDVSCLGASDGSTRFTILGTANFNYTINGGSSTVGTSIINLTGLLAGDYTIVITDSQTNCSATEILTVNGPPSTLSISTAVTPITCSNANGNVTINATGGWGGYTYEVAQPDATVIGPQGNNTFTNLTQTGTYTAVVTDSNGCMENTTFTLNVPTNPTATIDASSNYCYDGTNGATLIVNASGGQAPYEYSINGGPYVSNNTFNNLTPGNYDIVVRDDYGCTIPIPTETIANPLAVSTVITKDIDCTVSPDAVITGSITGGYAPYTYEVSFNGGAYAPLGTTGTPFAYSTGADGTYQFQITDAQGCVVQSAVNTINAITYPEITVSQTQFIRCNGDENAAIQVFINNAVGTPAFTINVVNDSTGTDYGTQTSGLPAGNYTITLTDSKSCTDTDTITIGEPSAIVVNTSSLPITCNALGVSKGSVIVNSVTGGTAPYNYFVTGTNGYSDSESNPTGTTSTTFDVVDFGLYQVNVVDANGCSVLVQDILVASPPDDLDISINTTANCTTGGEAEVSIGTALVGSGPFFFDIYRGFVPPVPPAGTWIPEDTPGSQSGTFTGLIPGVTYTFIVFDQDTGCSYYETATAPIPTNSTLTATGLTSNNITCVGSADGNVSFTVNSAYGSSTDVDYEIFHLYSLVTTGISGSGTIPANSSISVSNLGGLDFGTYFVLITETTGSNAGCSVVTVPFNINESAIDLSITAQVDNNANCNSNSGLISAIARDGTAPYQYQITTSATAPLVTDPSWASANVFYRDANNYYVHVMDAYGCIRSTPVIVLPMDPEPVIDIILTNECTATEGSFELDVNLVTPGVGPYSFSIDGGAFQANTAPFTISNLTSGIHTVEVQDANGCGNLVSITIEAPLGLSSTINALPSCLNNDGEIIVTGFAGSGVYTYEIIAPIVVAPQPSNVFSGLSAGTYTVRITDTTTLCANDANIELDAATPVTFTANVTDVTCNGDSDGSITVNLPATNDNPVYTYEIIAPFVVAPQTSNIFTGLAAGTYTVQVNSGRGCSATENIVIGEPTLLNASGVATDFACTLNNSVDTSTLTITETGGTAPFRYSIDGVNYFASNLFDIIDNGSVQNIDIYVRDSNNCIATNTVTINPLPIITATSVAVGTPIDCNGTGTVSITVTGGSGNLSYQMLPSGTPQASNIFAITSPGDYYFQVNDIDTGCSIITAPFTVLPFNIIDVVTTTTNAVTCFGGLDGTLEIDISGYSGPYTYEVFDSSSVSVFGIVPANTSTNPQAVTGLLAGSYTVVVTETASPFCSNSGSVIIPSPAEALTVVASETSNVTCDDNIGTITAVASGGRGSYEYQLTGASTVAYSPNGTFTNLSAGIYTVNVRDAGGCIASDGVTLVIPPPITATVAVNTPLLSCFGDTNGTITVSATSGGQGSNYSYTLNMISPTASTSGPQASNVFNDLAAGTYNVTVTDGYNCTFTSTNLVITEPTPIQASLVAATTPTCTTDAALTLSATGGTGTYEYSNSASFTAVLGTFTSSITITGATPGIYMYYVRDANGCVSSVSNEITIDPLPTLMVNLDITNASINCAGDNTGVIIATAEGGLGSYIYNLQDGTGTNITPIPVQSSPGVFTNLPVGTYQVQVDSGDCLTTSAQVSITEPTNPLSASFTVTDVTCTGSNDGIMAITASGGTGVIKYAISPQLNQFFDSPIFEDLAPGTYQAIAQDELGCFVILDFTIAQPIPVTLTIVPNSIIPEICNGDLDGEFSIEISGGTLPYSVSLDDINGTYTTGTLTQAQFDFTGLAGGDHIVYVRDAQGCESEWNITFPPSVLIDPTVEVDFGCINNLSTNTVTVTVDASVNPSDLDYSFNGGTYQASNIFTNVPPGLDHYVDVRHTNGCIQRTDTFDITAYDPLVLVLEDGALNEIVAIATGGTGDYEFTLNGVSYGTTNTFLIYESGDYTVTVTDTNGCFATATRYFEYIDVCIPNYFTPNNDGVQDEWGPGCTDQYRDMTFDIFDRYGRKVVTLRVGQKWDGTYNGVELPTGDYWYVVRLNDNRDNREFVGHFTLYR
ncbi:T9SS type B sorting domain-containing protein [Sabulilitoribacter arenilitoris]|uniref:T9SS type B sorting domain-containing protein n=1 Tax=Wocania arenilitoris TaxID=2044858 RepID=A0AAE3JKF0_9FLAO|nr:T9SS type B sorting domain-containing protein [Wocania arenilitoris]MCF7568028.1 T9SS type B sorting domain-containing protein [Wocania arenilitoris]